MNNDDPIRRGDVLAALAPFDRDRTHGADCHKRHVGCAVRLVLEEAPVPECPNCERLAAELETERVRLAACGVAAQCNTEESIALHGIGEDSPYYSASYGDVRAAVRREMELREENRRLVAERDELNCLLGRPTFQCRNCGSLGPFTDVTYEVPGEPTEYDMRCSECDSTEIAESPREAFQEQADRVAVLERELREARRQRAEAVVAPMERADAEIAALRESNRALNERAQRAESRVAELENLIGEWAQAHDGTDYSLQCATSSALRLALAPKEPA